MKTFLESVRGVTWVQPEEARGAAKVLPGESRVFLEVIDEHVVQSLRHVRSVQDIWICRKREEERDVFSTGDQMCYINMCVHAPVPLL